MILNQTGGTQFSAHCLRGAVIGRLEERWVQQGKPKLARRSFYLNQEKKSVLGTKPWSFWAEVLLKSPDHVQAPSCWLNQLTMALNWTYRAFCRELASARGAASESSLILDVFPSWDDKLMGLKAIDSRSGLFWIQNCTLIKKLANINLTLVETSHSFPSPGIIILIESVTNWLKGMNCFLKEILWNILNLWQICKDVFPIVGGTPWSIWKIFTVC